MASSELAGALRRWRDRVGPDAAGLPGGQHRRTPGLRREDLARLAGISVDYVTRLEQGRATRPSAQVIEALARALRLSNDERSHLFQLAGMQPPGPQTVPGRVTPGVQRMLDRLCTTPVAVYDAMWHLLLANDLYAALLGDPTRWRGHERNGVWRNFHGLSDRVVHTTESRRFLLDALTADLRAASARYPADQKLRRLVRDLRTSSDEFASMWDSGAVGRHESARKTVEHPQIGSITLDCDVLTVTGTDMHVMIYTARPDSVDAERLELLAVLGTQSIVDRRTNEVGEDA
jgi:transcriptional regulator with XRE-family HTH domain